MNQDDKAGITIVTPWYVPTDLLSDACLNGDIVDDIRSSWIYWLNKYQDRDQALYRATMYYLEKYMWSCLQTMDPDLTPDILPFDYRGPEMASEIYNKMQRLIWD